MTSCIYTGWVRHRRHRPVVHDFRYRVFMFYLDLDELAELDRTVRGFSFNRANVVSFHDRDHLDGQPGATKDKLRRFLGRDGLPLDGGRVFALTSCRVLGYVFNPITLYYCHEPSGALHAVVAEVRNTFGEQYLYRLTEPLNPGGDQAGTRRYRARKLLHVSPFVAMDAVYDFHLRPVGDTVAVGIVEYENGTHVLDAQWWGRRAPLTTGTLSRLLLTYPLMTLKTTVAIHAEALRLYLKGVPVYRRPSPGAALRRQQRRVSEL